MPCFHFETSEYFLSLQGEQNIGNSKVVSVMTRH